MVLAHSLSLFALIYAGPEYWSSQEYFIDNIAGFITEPPDENIALLMAV